MKDKGYKKLLYAISLITNLRPRYRRLILLTFDLSLLPLAALIVFWFQSYKDIDLTNIGATSLIVTLILVSLILYPFTGQYNDITRYFNSFTLYRIVVRNFILIAILSLIRFLFNFPLLSVQTYISLWLLISAITGITRFILRDALVFLQKIAKTQKTKVAIYGAGSAGAQLSASLRINQQYLIQTFLDDSEELYSRRINGIKICPPSYLEQGKESIDQVLLAIPSLTTIRRKEILNNLAKYKVPVLQIPSIEDIKSGKSSIDQLQPIRIENLLGREEIAPMKDLLGPGINNSVVCVSGAGGSIGSELCRQICKLSPSKLILLELSEPSLYSIYEELTKDCGIIIIPVLGNAGENILINRVFKEHHVDIVFHAAAYKHVPLVEENPLVGIQNNAIVTRSVCEEAYKCNLKQVVLISTDKAVRPTNIMGASKRLSELIVQSYSEIVRQKQTEKNRPLYSMVRFGNVLGSSGSVVPLFSKQIASGGPITLTHPDIIRYFMTIQEASLLVLQSSVLAKGGDLFLLDMGAPVLIRELAEKMIRLSGLSLKSKDNPEGNIEIDIAGLRPGEKLYEELLINAEAEPTKHPRIFRAVEYAPLPEVIFSQLDDLKNLLNHKNEKESLLLLKNLVPEWESYKEIVTE